MVRFGRTFGAVPTILFALFLLGCTEGLTEAEQRYNAGVELQREGRLNEAIVEYDEAIRLDPQTAEGYRNRGTSYGILGEYERALRDLNEAIRLDPELASAYVNRALEYTALGSDTEAQQDVDRAVELGFDRGELEGAIEEFKKQR